MDALRERDEWNAYEVAYETWSLLVSDEVGDFYADYLEADRQRGGNKKLYRRNRSPVKQSRRGKYY